MASTPPDIPDTPNQTAPKAGGGEKAAEDSSIDSAPDGTSPKAIPPEPIGWEPPVSSEWQKQCRRDGTAIVSLFLVALLAWITASQTFIVLSGSRLIHPSSLSWPLYICLAGIVAGSHVLAAANLKWLPYPPRTYEKPDHRLKYSLWFQDGVIEWHTFEDEPDTLNAQVGIYIDNAGHAAIVVELERLDVELKRLDDGATCSKSENGDGFIPLRLLPNGRKRFLCGLIRNIPNGFNYAEISYSLKYGPLSGFPVYRRTHKFRLNMRAPVTPRPGQKPQCARMVLDGTGTGNRH